MPKNELPGILIAVEGIDGAGKTTQVKMLAAALQAAGIDVITSKEPTDGEWGRKIRQSATTGRMPVIDELEAFVHDRTEHVETLVGPALSAGAVVILDRYYPSSIAYQGSRGQNPESIRQLMESRFPIPDLTIMLDIDPAVSYVRISQYRNEIPNEFEQTEALARALAIFRGMTSDHIVTIDGNGTIGAIHQAILHAFVEGPAKTRWCSKSYGCHDHMHCIARMTNSCRWFTLRGRLLNASAEV